MLLLSSTLALSLVAIFVDALPVDLDLPGIHDLEVPYSLHVALAVAWIMAMAFLYSSWALYASSPARVGFHREGILVDYDYRPRPSRGLRSSIPTSDVRWSEIRGVTRSGPRLAGRSDIRLEQRSGSPRVVRALAPEVAGMVLDAFLAHCAIDSEGTWQGHSPVALA